MPVRYDIAAQIPQYGGGGYDPVNMMAQLQSMDYRQQQNALAQMEMQKMFAGAAANAMGGAAQQDLMQTGGANIPPEIQNQVMGIIGGQPNG